MTSSTSSTSATSALPVQVLRPGRSLSWRDLQELRDYWELLYFMVWRDIKLRYRQTFLGVVWVIIQPLFNMAVFTVFLGRLGGMPSDGQPYAIFCLAALVPWGFFAEALRRSSGSVVEHQRMITKVYFPRLILPVSGVLSGLVDIVITVLLLLVVVWLHGLPLRASMLLLPVFTAMALLLALSVSIWLAALNAIYRDVRHAVSFLLQLWLFVSPVVYPSSLIRDETLRGLYGLNPLVGVIEGFRWAVLGGVAPPVSALLLSLGMLTVLLASGMVYFRRMERIFADVV